MTQPELGRHIAQLRIGQGFTQQDLADQCKLNIRTIQRIEAGDVVPRRYTLNLLTKPLNMDLNQVNNSSGEVSTLSQKMGWAYKAGIVFSINAIPIAFDLITQGLNKPLHIITVLIHIFSCVFFFGGFYFIGKFYRNRILYISSIIMMILLPAINILDLLKDISFSLGEYLLFIIMSINMIVLGAGLLKESFERNGHENGQLYQIAGILTIVVSIFYLSLNTRIQHGGLILSIPINLVMVYILYRELNYKAKAQV